MSSKQTLSEAILRSMVESPENLLIWAVDREFHYIFFNNSHKEKMKEFWAVDIELGKELFSYIDDPDYIHASKKKYEAVFNDWSGVSQDELTDCKGNTRYFDNYGNPIYDEEGKVIGAVMYTIEVTDRVLAEKALERISVTDRLTGLFNRDKLETTLQQEFSRASRYRRTFSLLLIDLDHFKAINDNYGHPVGDKVLSEIGEILYASSRHVDTAGRWGGEEFLIICPETDLKQASIMAEKIRRVVEEYAFSTGDRLTCSIGVSEFQKEVNISELLKKVDKALYEAKDSGRNKVVLKS